MKRTYYITGADGSGKTTFLKEVEKEILIKGKKTKNIWLRSPKILSKPLMAYCRLVGLTKYKTVDGVEYGKHEFYRSAFVSQLFPFLQLIDFKIKWYFFKFNIKDNDIILFDRFNLDTLADLMVATKNIELHNSWVGREFLKLTPKDSKILVLYVNDESTRNRKKDTLYDEHLEYKINVYKRLSKDLKIKLIDNNRQSKVVKKEILKFFKL